MTIYIIEASSFSLGLSSSLQISATSNQTVATSSICTRGKQNWFPSIFPPCVNGVLHGHPNSTGEVQRPPMRFAVCALPAWLTVYLRWRSMVTLAELFSCPVECPCNAPVKTGTLTPVIPYTWFGTVSRGQGMWLQPWTWWLWLYAIWINWLQIWLFSPFICSCTPT